MMICIKFFYPVKFNGGRGGSGVSDNLLWMYMVIIIYNIEKYCNWLPLPASQAA